MKENKIIELQRLAEQHNSDGTTFVDGQIDAAKKAMKVIFELKVLLSAACMRIDYYEEQEKQTKE